MATSQRPRRHLASSPFAPKPEIVDEVYEAGARVSHDSFGLGRVLSVQGSNSVQVDFGKGSVHVPLPCRSMTAL